MRKLVTLTALLFFALNSFGQMLEPAKWSFETKQVSNDEFDLIFIAKMDDGWSVYSQFNEEEDGPIPTSFHFDEGDHFTKVGAVKESEENKKSGYDEYFGMDVIKFFKKATFTQRVKVTDGSKPITGYLEFMTCDDSRCLPPTEVDYSFEVKPTAEDGEAEKTTTETPAKTEPQVKTQEKAEVAAAEEQVEVETPVEEQTTTAESSGENDGIEDPVTWSLDMEKISDTEYDLNFTAKVAKGWYIYSQHNDSEDGDGPIATSFWLDEGAKGELVGKAAEESEHKIDGHDKVFDMNVIKFKEEVMFSQKINVEDATKELSGYLEFMSCDDSKCLPPAEVPFRVTPASLTALIGDEAEEQLSGGAAPTTQITIDKSEAATCRHVEEKDKSLWGTFLLGIIGGLLALLTPCVWPMIPLTVSFFTKGAENKSKGLFNAFMYGFYILLVYVLLSVPFHLLDSLNPDILNEISTSTWLNVFFFAIFIFFALSFFGYYELTLPSSWLNKSSAAEGIGGAIGIFFMALTLALVSFSCTGPILGSLLAGTLSSNAGGDPAMLLTAGMAGFGFALALPFGLFAAFPSWLNSMPKSGGWMTTVKVTLGFLELALALKFLSNADLVNKWGLLKIEPFLMLWIAIFALLGLYFLGKIRFPHDSPLKKIPLPRLGFAIISFAFVVYLASGFSYKPLTLLSGLAPPVCYSWFNPCECPQRLDCFKDFDEGLAHAQKVGKPIIIDFTGHACVNCRKMEETVWPEPKVYKYLDEDFVLISLYVDEKIDLPEEEVVTLKSGKTRKLRYTGQRWQVLQAEEFQANTQPFYVLLSPDGKMLNEPVGYTPDEDEYADFLQCGLDRFKELSGEGLLGEKQ